MFKDYLFNLYCIYSSCFVNMCHPRWRSTQQSDLSVSYFGFVVDFFSFPFTLKCRAAPFHSPTFLFFLKAKCKSQAFISLLTNIPPWGFLSPLLKTFFFLKRQLKSDCYEISQRNFASIYRDSVILLSIHSQSYQKKWKVWTRLTAKLLADDLIDKWMFFVLEDVSKQHTQTHICAFLFPHTACTVTELTQPFHPKKSFTLK